MPEAEQRLRTALQFNQDLSSRASDAPAYAAARTQIRYKLANCLRRQGKDAEAESLLTAGLDAQRTLARRNPDADTHVIWTGRLSREVADLLLDNAREGEALAVLDKSAAETAAYLERTKSESGPSNGFIVGSLARTYRMLADVVRDQGDFARADAFDDQAADDPDGEHQCWFRHPGGNSRRGAEDAPADGDADHDSD